MGRSILLTAWLTSYLCSIALADVPALMEPSCRVNALLYLDDVLDVKGREDGCRFLRLEWSTAEVMITDKRTGEWALVTVPERFKNTGWQTFSYSWQKSRAFIHGEPIEIKTGFGEVPK